MKKFLMLILCAVCLILPASAVLTIDLTDFASGDSSTHTHVWVAKYDATNHWDECSLCGTTRNLAKHTLDTRYTVGEGSCSSSNYKITYCSGCAYSTQVKSQAAHNFSIAAGVAAAQFYDSSGICTKYGLRLLCAVCREWSSAYDATYADGTTFDITTAQLPAKLYVNGELARNLTWRVSEEYNNQVTYVLNSDFNADYTQLTLTAAYNLSALSSPFTLDVSNFLTWFDLYNYNGVSGLQCVNKVTKVWSAFTNILTVTTTIPISDVTTDTLNKLKVYPYLAYRVSHDDGAWYDRYQLVVGKYNYIPLNVYEPSITSASAASTSTAINGFTNSLTVTAAGQIVGSFYGYATLTDKATGDILYPRTKFVINEDDTYNLNLSLTEVGYTGGTAILKVEDYFGKSVTREIALPAVDTSAPTIANLDALDLTSTWAASKDLTLGLKEIGVGGIYIAINDDTSYTKVEGPLFSFRLTGEVYSQKNICVFLKDELGNTRTYLIPVDRLDDEPPTITDVEFAESPPTLTVSATDGTALSYRLNYGEWQTSNVFNLTTSGVYIVEVMDEAGNVTTHTKTVSLPEYTVTFKGWNDRVISTATYHYGDTVDVPCLAYDREPDDTYEYIPTGWDSEVSTTCTGDATYTQTYTATYREYPIIFYYWGIIKTTTYHYGDDLSTIVALPADYADEMFTYHFTEWVLSESLTAEYDCPTYVPDSIDTYIDYTITFKDWDGTIISSETYHYYDTVTEPVPTRAADNTYTYTFSGWDREVSLVLRDATYTAQYTATYIDYTVTFQDWDGTVISSKTYHYGDTFEVPDGPTRDSDAWFIYTFKNWGHPSDTVTCDTVYTAQYSTEYVLYDYTWFDWDGTVIKEMHDLTFLDHPIRPADPTRAADNTYTYEFAEWQPALGESNTDRTYTARYTATYIDYTVIFKDWDATELSSSTYHYGDTIVIPASPTRAADNTYTYAFSGWDDALSDTCNGDAVYTAQYTATYIDYTITFKDWDDTTLLSSTYHYGDTITLPITPTRPSTLEDTYTFVGWSPNVTGVVFGDATYVAQYAANAIEYAVKFLDWDGSILSSEVYHYGDAVILPTTPTRMSDSVYTYSFSEWTPAVAATVTSGAVYVAQYTPTYIDYTITFKDWDDTVLTSSAYHWGDTVTSPIGTYRAMDDTYLYTFSDWDSEITPVSGNKTYTAQYTAIYREYNIQFKDWDGTVLTSSTYHWGDRVAEPSGTYRAMDDTYLYTFDGWDEEVTPVDGNKTYTAQYTPVYRDYTITFKDWDDTALLSSTYHWGETITVPSDPTRGGYTFVGWSPTVVTAVGGDAVYTATYQAVQPSAGGASGAGLPGGINPELVSGSRGNLSAERDGDITRVTVEPGDGYVLIDLVVTDKDGNLIEVVENEDGTFSYKTTTGEEVIRATFVTVGYAETLACCKDGTCPLHSYTDVDMSGWYHDGTHYCVQQGLLVGISGDVFAPSTLTSRAMLVSALYRLEGAPSVSVATPYSDTEVGAWYADAVSWATSNGIALGYGDGTFGPSDTLTREQMAAILYRYLEYKEAVLDASEDVLTDFVDASKISQWAVTAMEQMCAAGLLQGVPGGELLPAAGTTRAQLAAVLLRLCETYG